jgi:hypothetical protein
VNKYIIALLVACASSTGHAQNNICEDSTKSKLCQAYVAGLVDGYIASKRKYTTPIANGASTSVIDRALANRVSGSRLSEPLFKPACLPKNVDKKQLVQHVLKNMKDNEQKLDMLLYDELHTRYSCKD